MRHHEEPFRTQTRTHRVDGPHEWMRQPDPPNLTPHGCTRSTTPAHATVAHRQRSHDGSSGANIGRFHYQVSHAYHHVLLSKIGLIDPFVRSAGISWSAS